MPPAEENGAADLQAAVAEVHETHGPSSVWTGSAYDMTLVLEDGQDGPTPAQVAPLTPIVEGMRPALERLEAALAKPRLRFAGGLDIDGNPASGHVRLLQEAARMLGMPASAESDPARRLAACRALLVLATKIERASLMDWMVARAAYSSGLACIRRGLREGKLDPAATRAACDELLRDPPNDDMRRAFRGEPVALIERYGAMLDGRVVPFWLRPNVTASARMKHRLDLAVKRLRGRATHLWMDMDLEPGQARLVVETCRRWEEAAQEDPLATLRAEEVERTPIDFMLPKLWTTTLRAEAQRRLARVTLALAERRTASGAYPATLDELRGAFPEGMPLDPYSDTPFLYETTPTGVRVSSPGLLPGETRSEDGTPLERGLVWDLPR
jgi:hypothetical protein